MSGSTSLTGTQCQSAHLSVRSKGLSQRPGVITKQAKHGLSRMRFFPQPQTSLLFMQLPLRVEINASNCIVTIADSLL